MLVPEVAAKVLFEALEAAGGAIPRELDALKRWVSQDLHAAVAKRLGDDEASMTSNMLVALLERGSQPEIPKKRQRYSENPTAEIELMPGRARVAVVADTTKLARNLQMAMGPRIAPLGVRDVSRLSTLVVELRATIVLVDASEPPETTPAGLAQVLVELAGQMLVVVWGTGTSFAQHLGRACGEAKITWLTREDGVDPLLDLIRSRQAS